MSQPENEPCDCGQCEWCADQDEYQKELEVDREVDLERI